MQYTYRDEDFVYAFDFQIGGDFVYPDDGIYSYKVRAKDGTILLQDEVQLEQQIYNDGENDLVTYPDSASFIIPAEYNTLESDYFDSRIVEVSYLYRGKPQLIRDSYRITDFYYFTATPKDVRDYFGLNAGELPDEDIDLNDVYFQLLKKHGDNFIDALNGGGVASIRANRLIVLKGVVQVFPSARLRVNQEENDGSSKFLRYLNKINWDDLLARALAEIEELENNLSGDELVSNTAYNPFYLGAVTDAITGETS